METKIGEFDPATAIPNRQQRYIQYQGGNDLGYINQDMPQSFINSEFDHQEFPTR